MGRYTNIENLKFVEEKEGFRVNFNTNEQIYTVFKDGDFLIGNKHNYSDVECYLK